MILSYTLDMIKPMYLKPILISQCIDVVRMTPLTHLVLDSEIKFRTKSNEGENIFLRPWKKWLH